MNNHNIVLKIISVVGARPNFMKIAPFIRAIEAYNQDESNKNIQIQHILVHTGQHYDDRMSEQFFKALNIPAADINLGVGSGSHAEQVGNTMIAFEKVLHEEKPDWVVVVGDVNATLSCSVTAKKEGVKVCHIEAGLRSRDMSMPEEINRLVTDRLSDLLLTPDKLSEDNLLSEGIPNQKIRFVGNIMIDTLEEQRQKAEKIDIQQIVTDNCLHTEVMHKISNRYGIVTLHRPSNVDQKEVFEAIIHFLLEEVVTDMQLLWPVHPRALKQIEEYDLLDLIISNKKLIMLHPLGYHDMLRLNMGATVMMTDSGGLQEECTVLGTPCLTLRFNTERPVTLKEHGGSCMLVGNDIDRLKQAYHQTLTSKRIPTRPSLWDGKTANRCLQAILQY